MAYGEIKVSGDDVLEALTYTAAANGYERKLNDDGERIADLIMKRIMAKLTAKLAAPDEDE